MHKENYNINIACFCNKNITSSLEELKSFFSFNLLLDYKNFSNFKTENISAIISDLENSKKLLSLNFKKPKILIQENKKIGKSKDIYSLIIKLPLDIIQFNQDVINVCKKFEFKNNSLINIKDYILDKNERVLRKNNLYLKITEKEINFIENLHSSSVPMSKEFILKNVWNYSVDTDTHTVETHIYRLRKKIKAIFDDNNFIKSSKSGYVI